jgi:HSP20 family protein
MSLFQNLIPSLSRVPVPFAERGDGDSVPTVKPTYDVRETDDAYALTVYLPGIAKGDLELTAEEGQLRIFARRNWQQPAGWTSLYRESADAAYELVLAHDNAIDPEKISAELRDGVLQVTLQKHEAIKPRKIAVT